MGFLGWGGMKLNAICICSGARIDLVRILLKFEQGIDLKRKIDEHFQIKS